MSFSLPNRALLRGMLAGAVVFSGTACHRSDRTESGRDKSAAVLPDTSSNAAQPSGGGTATAAVSDTATTSGRTTSSAQPSTSAQSNTPRAETAAPSDKDAAGYRSMERDTTDVASQRSDSARVTADTADLSSVSSDRSLSQISTASSDSATAQMSAGVADTGSTETASAADTNVSADTTTAGYSEMARDTSTVADQADTAAVANGEVVLKTTDDSTEILGSVTTDEAADETADEQVVRSEDSVTVAASETRTDEVGAAAIGGNVTGAEAVALMTREGLRCAVVDPEGNQAVRWDMSNTPITLNPCGMGSMILSRIWTAGQRDGGTAGQ